jgi:hypothetical protein
MINSDIGRRLLVDIAARTARKQGITVLNPEVAFGIDKLSDYEVQQIFAEALYYYRHQKSTPRPETASQKAARDVFYNLFDRLHL